MTSLKGRPWTPKLYTFDLEGTLVDLEAQHFLSFEMALGDLGVSMTVADVSAVPGAIGGGDPYIAGILEKQTGHNSSIILERKNLHFESMISEQAIAPRVGAVEFVEKLQGLGHRLALGSLTPRKRGETILRQSGLNHYFPRELTLFREDVVNGKPDPEVYRKTAQRSGVVPGLQLVFEDSVFGIQAATRAGSKAIAVPTPVFYSDSICHLLLQSGACAIFAHWGDINFKAVS